jgi:signal transduction histidine kinase
MQPELPERVREGLLRIDQAARRMIEMTATLLDFTQSRFRGGLPIAPSEMDLDSLCRGVIDELRIAHPGRDIRVTTDGDLRGEWDPARMAQVVSNLVGNAITHGDGSAPIEVQLRADEAEVAVAVKNRGEPIPEELAGRIFEPFQQGDRDGTRGGLGLGLFIVQQIVSAHGGTVSVRSSHDDTCFTVCLKREQRAQRDN